MNSENSLQASFWVMIILQTLGSVDMPGKGNRKMPAPRAYLAVLIAWGVLHLIADAGKQQAAQIAGWILVLTGIVVGPFGSKITGVINNVAPPTGGAQPLPDIPPSPISTGYPANAYPSQQG